MLIVDVMAVVHLPPCELDASGAAARELASIGPESLLVVSPEFLSASCGGD